MLNIIILIHRIIPLVSLLLICLEIWLIGINFGGVPDPITTVDTRIPVEGFLREWAWRNFGNLKILLKNKKEEPGIESLFPVFVFLESKCGIMHQEKLN